MQPKLQNASTLIDTRAAAVAANVPPGTIRRWAHEGRIARHGTDNHRRTLYDLNEVTRVADTIAARRPGASS